MSATTIDQVIARLQGIVEQSIASNDRRGYFAAVYNRISIALRASVAAGEFEDGPRMDHLDVVFANRYLDAYDAYERGEATTTAWQRAFDAARHDDLFVVQHVLLGMIAHIALDLGIATANVAPGQAQLESLHRDFDRVNDVLASQVKAIEDELISIVGLWEAPVATLLDVLEIDAHGLERSAAMLVMDWARAQAWRFATELAPLPAGGPGFDARVDCQDALTTRVAEGLLLTAPAAELVLRVVRRDVAADIRLLASHDGAASGPKPQPPAEAEGDLPPR